jgi:mono/diheme cytochrome c family protein
MHEVENKWKIVVLAFCFLLLPAVFLSLTLKADNAYGTDKATIKSGKEVFEKYCIICHGDKGDGKGLIGIIHRVEKSGLTWSIYPRDFTVGVFKFRSTSTGCLPTDDDLMLIIENGIPRSGMPSHKDVSLKERKAVKEYIKTFAKRWEEEDPCDPITAKKPNWVGSRASVDKGEKVFKEMKCFECHGYEGKGDGPKSDELKDDWGDKILAFDFTTGTLKRGSSPENIYITYTTGLDGSGMPSYEDSVKEENRWNLCSYTLKLMGLSK